MTTTPRRDLFHLLSHAEHHATQRLGEVLDTERCSIEQWRVLALLADASGHPMTELADFALLLAPTATKLIDRMVTANLVYRRPDPTDRRRVLVYLSERGQNLHTQLAVRVAQLETDLCTNPELRTHLTRLTRLTNSETGRAHVS